LGILKEGKRGGKDVLSPSMGRLGNLRVSWKLFSLLKSRGKRDRGNSLRGGGRRRMKFPKENVRRERRHITFGEQKPCERVGGRRSGWDSWAT